MPAKSGDRIREKFLEELSETLDVHKTIQKLNITEKEAREIIRDLIPRKVASSDAGPLPLAAAGKYEIFVDGASRGNPGQAGAGIVIRDHEGNVIKKLKRYLGVTTNNVAEYQALVTALEAAHGLKIRKVQVFADSELMVKQIKGIYKVKSPDLKPLYEKARGLLETFMEFGITHVYREENGVADGLANEAIDER